MNASATSPIDDQTHRLPLCVEQPPVAHRQISILQPAADALRVNGLGLVYEPYPGEILASDSSIIDQWLASRDDTPTGAQHICQHIPNHSIRIVGDRGLHYCGPEAKHNYQAEFQHTAQAR
jgi:hypothetical protein